MKTIYVLLSVEDHTEVTKLAEVLANFPSDWWRSNVKDWEFQETDNQSYIKEFDKNGQEKPEIDDEETV